MQHVYPGVAQDRYTLAHSFALRVVQPADRRDPPPIKRVASSVFRTPALVIVITANTDVEWRRCEFLRGSSDRLVGAQWFGRTVVLRAQVSRNVGGEQRD
mgnify:CR=1 FL=1